MKVKQDWTIGKTVKVGFLTLKIISKNDHNEYYRPFAYILQSAKGAMYQFTPYFGLEKL